MTPFKQQQQRKCACPDMIFPGMTILDSVETMHPFVPPPVATNADLGEIPTDGQTESTCACHYHHGILSHSGSPPLINFERVGSFHQLGVHMWRYDGRQTPCADCKGPNTIVSAGLATIAPPVDMLVDDRAVVVSIWLPGVKADDVKIKWSGESNTLCIKGSTQRRKEAAASLVYAETDCGDFKRCIPLPALDLDESIDRDHINAKLEDGVLEVTLPKMEKDWTEVESIPINLQY